MCKDGVPLYRMQKQGREPVSPSKSWQYRLTLPPGFAFLTKVVFLPGLPAEAGMKDSLS